MKKNLLGWLAMAAMLVGTGCSTDEVVNNYSPENAIEFGTYVGRDASARVAATDLNEVKSNGFGVYANYTNGITGVVPNFMNNQSVTWNTTSSVWEYSPIKYWPNTEGAKVSFWAYSPYDESVSDASRQTPYFKISDGTDYVVANAVYSKQSVNENVTFNFEHIMSKVGFKVEAIIDEIESGNNGGDDETTDATTTYPIANETSIVVTDVILKGKLDQAGTMTGDANGWNMTLSGNTTREINYALNYTHFANSDGHAYSFENDAYKTLQGQSVTISKEQLNNAASYFMFLPQIATFTITVKYNVITADNSLATRYSNVENEYTATVNNFTFARGFAYDFVLHIGMTSVKLSAGVSLWGDETDKIVNVPINTTAVVNPVTPTP